MNREKFFLRHLHGKVLDVGCVQGRLHSILQSKRDLDLWGVDVVDPWVTPNFRRGNVEALPFKENEFDCVVLGELIEHAKNPVRALEECNRVMKRHGTLLISTPNKNSWLNTLFKAYEGKASSTGHGHQELFTPDRLERMLEVTGFCTTNILLFRYNTVSNSKTRYRWFHPIRVMGNLFMPTCWKEQIVIKAIKI